MKVVLLLLPAIKNIKQTIRGFMLRVSKRETVYIMKMALERRLQNVINQGGNVKFYIVPLIDN